MYVLRQPPFLRSMSQREPENSSNLDNEAKILFDVWMSNVQEGFVGRSFPHASTGAKG
jgi:hypothetical protein